MVQKITILIISILLSINIPINAQSSSDIQLYIAQYKQIALEQEQKYGIPASITLAQGILESAAGKSMLTRNANNHFGVKAYGGWTGAIYHAWDDEKQKSKFRKYASAQESFRDHSIFLRSNSRYSSLFAKSVFDYRAWAIGLQIAGYATASNYAKALIGFIDAYRLYSINGGVKLRPGRTVTITKVIRNEVPVIAEDCIMNEEEESQEEEEITKIVKRFVVDINNVRCTLLYPGQTLASIAMKYDIPQCKILEYNELSSIVDIQEGDVIYLQHKKDKYSGIQDFYRVGVNETLYSISQKFGMRMASLAKLNGKTIFDHLEEGERLRLK